MRLIDNNDYVKAKTSYKNTKASTYTIEDILKRNDPQESSSINISINIDLAFNSLKSVLNNLLWK